MSDDVDLSRRHFLTVATVVTGTTGAVIAAAPFVASWRPSARAQALGAPVEVNISKIEEGAMVKVEWRGKTVALVKRDKTMLERLPEVDGELRDPESAESDQPSYATNTHRSIKPEVLVVVANCTHLGCIPLFKPEVGAAELGPDWPGGFYCPCHGSTFDLAGRVFKGVPAPKNLDVPPYRFLGESMILIGDDAGVA